jgi:heme oxygenase
MTLREATAELHSKAEKMEFNQRMLKGELTTKEYLNYLTEQYAIFEALELGLMRVGLNHLLTPFQRTFNIALDVVELWSEGEVEPNMKAAYNTTRQYITYLDTLEEKDIQPHLYLNYMALLFGGQLLKVRTPGKGKMYDFDQRDLLISTIRDMQKNEWADEVNKGFEFIINILDELQTKS